jgi:hypothetical protein
MSKVWFLNALLAAVVAALGLIAYLKPGTQAPTEHVLATGKAEQASSIRVERAGTAAIVLEKKRDGWFMTAPFAARADSSRVEHLLAITEAKSAHRLAATDLARFELERPEARLAVNGQRFDFGMVNPVSREQYVLTGGAVYTISLRYGSALPSRPADLIDKRLFGAEEVPVHIELKEFTVGRNDGKWTLDPPRDELSQDDFQRWMDGWRHASAVRVEPYTGGNALAEVGLQLQNGGKLTLMILARQPELALLRPAEKLVYYFLSGQAKQLLAPPDSRQ